MTPANTSEIGISEVEVDKFGLRRMCSTVKATLQSPWEHRYDQRY